MGIAFASLTSSDQPSKSGPEMLAFVNDSCQLELIARSSSSNDPFALKSKMWREKLEICSEKWSRSYSLEKQISTLLEERKVQDSLTLLNSAKEQLFTVHLVVFITYKSKGSKSLSALIELCAGLQGKELRIAAYQSIFTRMDSFEEMQSMDILNFHYALSKEKETEFSQMLEGSKRSIIGVINNICEYISALSSMSVSNRRRKKEHEFSKLSKEVQKFFIPLIAEKCFVTDRYQKALHGYTIFTNDYLFTNGLKCDFNQRLFLEYQNTDFLDGSFAGRFTEAAEKIVKTGETNEDMEKCLFVIDGMKNHTIRNLKEGVYLKRYDSKNWRLFKRTDQTFLGLVFPYLIKERYGGNSKNGSKLIEFFWHNWRPWNSDNKIPCEGSRLLAEEMKKYERLASLELISLVTQIQKLPIDCLKFSSTPGWLSLIFPGVKKTCDFAQDLICTASVVDDLSSVIFDIKIRNENTTQVILVVNFVIQYLQNITSDITVLQNLTHLERMTEPILNLTLHEMKKQFTTDGPDELNLFTTIYEIFDRSVFRFYLPQALQWVEKFDINKLIRVLDRTLIEKELCFCVEKLYLELKRRSKEDSIETFRLSIFVEQALKNKKNFKIDTSADKLGCLVVLENLKKIIDKHLTELTRFYLSEENSTSEKLIIWLENYSESAPWILEKLVERIDINKSEDADRILDFNKKVLQEYAKMACPSLRALVVKVKKAGFEITSICKELQSAQRNANVRSDDQFQNERLKGICEKAFVNDCM